MAQSQPPLVIDDEFDTTPAAAASIWARVGAEFVGTFMLVLFGVGAALYAVTSSGVGVLGVALAFGISVMAGVAAFGHISGGHFNPAVTVAMGITGRTSWVDVPIYIVSQLAGAISAAAVLFVVAARHPELQSTARQFYGGASNGYAEHSPLTFDMASGLVMEVVVTAVFVAVILGVTAKGAADHLAPLIIGLTLTGLVAITIPITNASLNPARSTASALFSPGWAMSQLWLFWVAPIAGAVIAALLYRAFAPVADAFDDDDVDVYHLELDDETFDEVDDADAQSAEVEQEASDEVDSSEDGKGDGPAPTPRPQTRF